MKRLYLSYFFLLMVPLVFSSQVLAESIPLNFSGMPMVSESSGAGTGSVGNISYWTDVGSVQGVSIDMEVEILANTSADPNSVAWYTEAGSAKLALTGEGAQRVDVAYRFYISGTHTPVVVSPEAVFRGLDGGLRSESISTVMSQVASYVVDSVTAISAQVLANGSGAADDVLVFTSSSGKNLVTNSGFEDGNTGFLSSYTFLGEHSNGNDAVSDWGEDRYGLFSDNRTGDSANSYFNQTLANNGDAFIIIDIGSDVVNPFWQMTVALDTGKNYVFSAYLANINDSNDTIKPNVNFVLSSSDGVSVLAESGDLVSGGSNVTPWREFTSEFTATGTSNTLQLIANSAGLVGNDLAMDDVVIREVLPSSQVAVQINLQPASVFYFTFEKADGLGEFSFDCSLPDVFLDPQETVVDLIPPSDPTFNSPVYTLDATPVLDGTADPYTNVQVTVAGAEFELNADGRGNWSLDTGTHSPSRGAFTPAIDGTENSVTVSSRDEAGNTSGVVTGSLYIQQPMAQNAVVTAVPEVLIANGNSVAQIKVQARDASNNNMTIGGSQVELNVSLGSLGPVSDNGDGTYSATLTSATSPGVATVTGTLDGEALPSLMLEFVTLAVAIDIVAGDDVIDQYEDDQALSVSGTTRYVADGQTVTVTLNGVVYEGTVDSGRWSVLIPAPALQALGTEVTITADVANPSGDSAEQAIRQLSAVNDAPVITLADTPLINEDAEGVVLDGAIVISDAEYDVQTVTLNVVGGALSLDPASADIELPEQDLNDMQFSGSLANVNTALASLIFTPAANLHGTNAASIEIISDDGQGGVTMATLPLIIAAVNDAPTITGMPASAVDEGVAYRFTPTAADVDGDTLVFTVTGAPTWSHFDQASGSLTGTPGNGDEGLYENIEISVSDGELIAALPAFALTVVAAPNSAPVAADQVLDVTENVPLIITLSGTDADQDPLTFTFEPLPAHGQLSGTGAVVTYTPAVNYVGPDQFGYSVSDADDSSALATITLNVLADLDGDGVPDISDPDDDGDGLSDADEGEQDPDGDGLPNSRDPDSDGDGLADSDEGLGDSDRDGIPDYLDQSADEDGDGIPDVIEGLADSDGDGQPDAFDSDSDNDGLSDEVEGVLFAEDSDLDGIDDHFDVDNTGGSDSNGDGIDDAAGANDQDGDGLPDYLDRDSDGDSLPDAIEGEMDSNLDGEADFRDLDSDSDGLPDTEEAGSTHVDTDGDGIDDHFDVDQTGGADGNGDGVDDVAKPSDSDADGAPDYRDVDSDGDDITDDEETGAGGTDTDNDGIDDVFDVDVTGGDDEDGDGIDDQLEPLDSDGDGTPNYLDEDSDNDGIDDVTEGTGDEDGDGIPNYLDTEDNRPGDKPPVDNNGNTDSPAPIDRDGDGVPDVLEGQGDSDGDDLADYLDQDSDNDGVSDALEAGVSGVDTDADGIDDQFDVDQTGGQDANGDGIDDAPLVDHDGDGLADAVDRDSDNDSIPDAVEGNDDWDDDGLPNRLDRDSDGDGLSDWLESGGNMPSGNDSDQDGFDDAYDPDFLGLVDSDGDGIADQMDVDISGGIDANGDGIDDDSEHSSDYGPLRDTDGDGQPDRFDHDSDADGLSDTSENVIGTLIGLDLDWDGLDDGIDASVHNGADVNGDGVLDDAIDLTDTDNDGLLAYRDADKGVDVDKGEVDKGAEAGGPAGPRKIKTAVRGAGSINPFVVFVLLLFGFIRLKGISMKRFIPMATVVMVLLMPLQRVYADREDGRRFYFGGGLGASELMADENNSGWNAIDHSDSAFKLFVGYQISKRLFVELDYTDLGAVGFEPYAPLVGDPQEISYKIPALSAGYYLFNPDRRWNLFLRAGVASIMNDATGDEDIYEKNTDAQLLLGAGLEWKLTGNLFLRAEASSFDRDARSYLLSLGYAFGHKAAALSQAAPDPLPTTVSLFAVPQGYKDDDEDGVVNEDDRCPNTAANRLVDDNGCDLDSDRDGVLDLEVVEIKLKVLFDTGSSIVKQEYLNEIQALADFMKEYPDIDVQIEGHTDDVGDTDYNQGLSESRAQAVAWTLMHRMGIARERIRTLGYGESQPLIAETTAAARRQNRRVIVVISRDASH